MTHPDVSGLILAGGASRRFGTDKARHPIEGTPMIQRVYGAVAPLVSDVFVSVRPTTAPLPIPATPVVDRYEAGPLAGLHAGLQAATTPWVLAVACDLPLLTRDVLDRLIAARDEEARPVVSRTPDGRLQPLCACYPASAADTAEHLIHRDSRALHALLDALRPLHMIDVPAEPLRNVNRKRDLPAS